MGKSAGSAAERASGGCLCSSVRFTAALRERHFSACHCGMCRRWTAGPFLSLECRDVAIADPSHLGVYRSSAWAERGFCKQCGTSLFYRLVDRDFYAVSTEAFDNTGSFAFTSQIFIDEKPVYYDFANSTTIMTGPEVFAAFAADEAGKGA
jgi:hypothetical protein